MMSIGILKLILLQTLLIITVTRAISKHALKLYQTAIDKAFNDSSVFASGSQFCDEIELIEILNNKGYALASII